MPVFTNTAGERVRTSKATDGSVQREVLNSKAPITAFNNASEKTKASVGATNAANGFSADGKTKTGITTSRDAENRGKAANDTLNGLSPAATGKEVENPLTAMYKRLTDLQTQLATAKEKEATAASTTPVADTGTKPVTGTGATPVADTSGMSPETASQLKYMQEGSKKTLDIITNQANVLNDYRQQFNETTQADIDSIARTAERAAQTQMAANERTADAMRFAGVIGGRAQFAPTVEASIIHEVIQEGLDKVEVINEKKNTAIREARKAEAEFNIDIFEQQSELAKEYQKEIEDTFAQTNAFVRQAEADERERTNFRQAQEERNSLILAEEMLDATPEQIMQAAAMNGIDPGLLTKAINDARFEKQSNDLDIEGKQENILSSKDSRANEKTRLGFEQTRLGLEQSRYNLEVKKFNADQAKGDTPEKEKPMTVAELEYFEKKNGWSAPLGMNQVTANAINAGLNVLPADVRSQYATLSVSDEKAAEGYLKGKLNEIADISIKDKLNQPDMEAVKASFEGAAKKMKLNKVFNLGDYQEVAKTAAFKESYKEVFVEKMKLVADPNSTVSIFETDERFLAEVLDRTLASDAKARKAKEQKEKEATEKYRKENPYETSGSTAAVNF